ncbi:palmitoyltransferase ZDHHC15B-like isoform X3 [Mercenaria mercenaria]|uniref:palmitoyltransferase ZDHHC15B-like isoform X3 n=1 Tax=Mercenaria mercenaria TaxID=6596 RepID=UPI00234F344A|nr:palmitoyltransferase ZDHHC15B-like isoform X3 [Mercenaria mercenaria]
MAPTAIRLCCAAFRWTPVVFISAIVVWSYYAYVIQMCILTVDSVTEKVLYLLLYHPLLVMFVWSYGKTIFTPVGTVPKKFYLPHQDADKLMRETNEEAQKNILIEFARNSNLPVQNRTHSGAPRYCEKCRCIKPDRCHHCSVCGTCVLKMDHHCPWVNNCVGFTTYKFFVMFLGYALVYCIYVALTSLKYFISFWSKGINHNMGHFHVLFLFFVAVMFGISLISLFGYHIYLTVKNRSTLESFRSPIFQSGPDKNGFSLGKYNNFIEIFGENKKLWFIPVFTSEGDGVTFPTPTTSTSSSYQTMGTTSPSTIPSSGDGVTYPTRTVDLDSDGLLADRQRWMEEGDLDSNITNGYGSYNRDSGVRLAY